MEELKSVKYIKYTWKEVDTRIRWKTDEISKIPRLLMQMQENAVGEERPNNAK